MFVTLRCGVRWALATAAAIMAAGCATTAVQGERGFCGISFCLLSISADRVQVSSTTPEDFKLYRVTTEAGLFTIYEGNFPMRPGRRVRRISSNIRGAMAEIFRNGEVIEARIDRGIVDGFGSIGEPAPLPQYIVAYRNCTDEGDCGVAEFSRLIVPREGAVGCCRSGRYRRSPFSGAH